MENDLLDENIEALTKRNKLIVTICTDAYVSVGGGGYVYKDTYCRSCYVDEGYQLEEDEYYAGGFPEDGEWVDRGSGGGGGGSQPHYYVGDSWTFKFPNLNNIYGMTSTLNAYQKGKLEKALDLFSFYPYPFQYMYEKLSNVEGLQIKFKMDPNINTPAQYNVADNSISFQSESSICWTELVEEILHAVQYNVYYGDVMNNLFKNYDFEAKVFYDLAFGISVWYDSQDYPLTNRVLILDGRESFKNLYNNWIEPHYEKGYLPQSEYNTFNSICDEWQGHDGATISTFIPKMIRESFGKVRPPLKP